MITVDFILGVIFGTLFGAACISIIVRKERRERNEHHSERPVATP